MERTAEGETCGSNLVVLLSGSGGESVGQGLRSGLDRVRSRRSQVTLADLSEREYSGGGWVWGGGGRRYKKKAGRKRVLGINMRVKDGTGKKEGEEAVDSQEPTS